MLEALDDMLGQHGIHLTNNIRYNIMIQISNSTHPNNHFCFIIDLKSGNIVCYESNLYLCSNSFPYSQHAEVNAVTKWYSHRNFHRYNKLVLIVVKLSRCGQIGNSKCCLHCMRFLRNNYDNLGLRAIYYSMPDKLHLLLKADLKEDNDFTISGGYRYAHK